MNQLLKVYFYIPNIFVFVLVYTILINWADMKIKKIIIKTNLIEEIEVTFYYVMTKSS